MFSGSIWEALSHGVSCTHPPQASPMSRVALGCGQGPGSSSCHNLKAMGMSRGTLLSCQPRPPPRAAPPPPGSQESFCDSDRARESFSSQQ